MALSPASSKAATFNGGTITEVLTVTTGGASSVIVNLPAGSPGNGVKVNGTAQSFESYFLANDGNLTMFEANRAGTQIYGNEATADVLYVEAFAAQNAGINLASFRPASGVNRLKITRGCYLKFKAPAEPADAELSASEVAFWFDSTDGVGNTKLMVKGKSADGTVKSATILLA